MRKLLVLLMLLLCTTGVTHGQDETVTGYGCECLIDGVSVKRGMLPPDGGQAQWQIDAAAIPLGLHQVQTRIVQHLSSGISATAVYDALCFRISDSNSHQVTATCHVDGKQVKTSSLPTNGTTQAWTLDLSDLPEGLHHVNVNITDVNRDGIVTTTSYDAMCYRASAVGHHEVTAACFVDGELKKKSTIQANGNNQTWVLDLSELPEGIHQVRVEIADKNKEGFVATAVYEATCYRMAHGEGHDVTATCYVDDKLIQTQEIVADGNTLTWTLDLAQLPIGLHRLKVSIADKNKEGVVTTANYDAMFYRISNGGTHDVTAACYVDEHLVNTTTLQTSGAAKTWTLDLATLPRGIHHVRVNVTDKDSEGIATTAMYDAMCYRGVGRVVDCEYWINDDNSSYGKVELAEPQMEYTLISLLPVPKQKIRSKKFHFEVNAGEPNIYAKNDILVRFNTEDGSYTDVNGEYVDYRTSQQVDDITLLQPGETKTAPMPQDNEILWYKVEAVRGDSLSFKADRACTIQIFSPSGEELEVAMGEKSTSWMGVHAPKDGTYYIAQHDMTATQSNTLSISYEHIDRYAILDYDVHTVGNGGASTITFNGNGFDDLYAIDLIGQNGDSIHHVELVHMSNSSLSATFDFLNATLGSYGAIFYFVEGNLRIDDFLKVEDAQDIELDLSVSYPSSFLVGTPVTYTINVTNKSNMTAYAVPLELELYVNSKSDISRIIIDGFVPHLTVPQELIGDSLEIDVVNELERIIETTGDLCQFIFAHDSISGGDCGLSQIIMTIPPNSTKTFTVTIQSNSAVLLDVTLTEEWFPVSFSSSNGMRKVKMNASFRDREWMCCYRERIECIVDALANIIGLATSPAAGCVASLIFSGLETWYDVWCSEGSNAQEMWQNYLNSEGQSLAGTLIQTAISCVTAAFRALKHSLMDDRNIAAAIGNTTEVNRLNAEIQACRTMEMSAIRNIYNGLTTAILGRDCYKAFKETKPNCPPKKKKGGGKSSPVVSLDPNEMLGYLAPSGSKYIAKDVTNVYYTICFENDTVAMAPANVIVLNDTIDGRVHDLNTFAPKQIRIGNRLEMLDGTPNFVKTIDMRPEINCIAQVECNYDGNRGIAQWTLSSLDPMTLEPITDYNQGLLPVNYNGNGQGEVSYDISLKKGLADGTRIVNRAAITFDSNDPIMTPDWVNIIDGVKPTSRVIDCELLNDSVAAVSIRGEDDRSGPWRYDIYAQYGGGDWYKAASEVPIDRAAQVRVYEGIEHHFYAVLTDSAGNVEVKEPVRELTFDYFSSDTETNLRLNLAKGWNWMSHNLNEPLSVDALKPNAYRIMSHDGETINDPRYGYTGTVSTLSPTELYKVEMGTADNIQLSGKLFNSALKPVPLVQGWNWIGYPMAGAMSVNEALVLLDADEDDCIVGQDGTAVFNDGLWRGTLTTLEPGKGYLLKTSSDKLLRLNASRASVRLHAPAIKGQDDSEIWTVDIHRYPNVTPIIADLWDGYTLTSQVGYGLAAFVGDECRGIAREVNGRWMMNVYGVGGEKITFKALDRSTGLLHDISESETFTADLLGTMALPVQLHIADASGLSNVMFDGVSVKPTLTTGPVTIEAGAEIDEVEVVNVGGVTIMGYSNISSGFTLDLSSEPDGIYLVKVTTGKNVSTVKVLKRSH